jgi:hypothetical protein
MDIVFVAPICPRAGWREVLHTPQIMTATIDNEVVGTLETQHQLGTGMKTRSHDRILSPIPPHPHPTKEAEVQVVKITKETALKTGIKTDYNGAQVTEISVNMMTMKDQAEPLTIETPIEIETN